MLLQALVLALAQADTAGQVSRFLAEPSLAERRALAAGLVAAGADFDEVLALLRAGRVYSADVPRGRIARTRTGTNQLVHPYLILVPTDYTPERRWPVRLDLHGGMGADAWEPEELAWAGGWAQASVRERIVIVPAGWWDSMWWEHSQADNLEALLAEVKRTWNVDEDRVVVYGGSDGCIGAYFLAFRTPDRWAGYAGHVGSPDRLVRAELRPDGQMHLSNLRDQVFHLGFGERDPKTPLKHLEKYLALFEEHGARLDWYVLAGQAHALRVPAEKERALGRFLWDARRDPLPDHVTWATERTDRYARRSWLVIDELAPGTEVDETNLLPRWGSRIQLRGATTTPRPWGRVEAERRGNELVATTRGVRRFRLLLSPDELDLAEPVRVVVDGETVHDDHVEPDLATLLRWAAVDEDRRLLFAAEVVVELGG